MALVGNIKEFGLADIFQIISLQQKTGSLGVKGKEGNVSILLEKGLIVGADADFRPIGERLQRALTHSSAISKFQLRRAIETEKKTSQPLWTILAETKAIDIGILQNLLSQQIHETVYHVLRWPEGEYRFDPQKSVEYDQKLINPVNTEFLVMEGFRITDEWTDVEKVITSFQLLIRRKADAPDVPAGLSAAESKIYALLMEERSIQDLIDIGQIGDFDTCQTTYELIRKGLVEPVSGGKHGKNSAVSRRPSVRQSDLLLKIARVAAGIIVLAGAIVGLRALPQNLLPLQVPDFQGIDQLKRFSAQSQLSNLSSLVREYYLAYKKFPESFQEMQQAGVIRSDRALTDPWGDAYSLDSQAGQLTIRSSHGGREHLHKTISF
ncbi:hypothetical protein CSB45_14370 [candidate division KSB3 bacterium]|uniref:PatA-like N-terminal domain-containing protein n=1 Tax=candidate division KSB3 bacterium TaxID=2044937 RepID=A0A2G6E155_9BACT|nr:MAG: hypothetical protein CSB45_14370 [candidate division KSB3 bacterium]PIE30339.1 MAG: hypothetical protein CSA57_03370 [candidate division KSB3 bacterium]